MIFTNCVIGRAPFGYVYKRAISLIISYDSDAPPEVFPAQGPIIDESCSPAV